MSRLAGKGEGAGVSVGRRPAVADEPAGRELNVCLAAPLFHPDYAGSGVRFRRYAPGLKQRGIQLHVVAAEVGAWKRDRRQYAEDQGTGSRSDTVGSDPPVHRVRLPSSAGSARTRWAYESAVLARCRTAEARPDLVIWLSLSPNSVPTLFRFRRHRFPMISVQTMVKRPAAPGWKGWLKRRAEVLQHRLVDCVVVSSGYMEDGLRKRGIETRVEVIPHGVDLERFRPGTGRPTDTPVRRRLGLDATSEVVLFVGPINERKGLAHLAAAWDRIAGERLTAHLVLVGPEREEGGDAGASFADGLRATLESGRGSDRVRFVGPVSDVEAYLGAADVFVFPSHREGMPNVVCEAFACGVPTVLTPFLGLSEEFGRPGEHYVLVQHDAEQLAGAVLDLLSDPDSRHRLGQSARRWAEEELDLERSLDRLATIVREVVGPDRPAKRRQMQ